MVVVTGAVVGPGTLQLGLAVSDDLEYLEYWVLLLEMMIFTVERCNHHHRCNCHDIFKNLLTVDIVFKNLLTVHSRHHLTDATLPNPSLNPFDL